MTEAKTLKVAFVVKVTPEERRAVRNFRDRSDRRGCVATAAEIRDALGHLWDDMLGYALYEWEHDFVPRHRDESARVLDTRIDYPIGAGVHPG